jgi:pilus assembly protein CpaE
MTQLPVDAPVSPATPVATVESTPRLIGVVVVLSAKGGAGGTLISAHLAASLAAEKRVCLVDLDLCKGDVAGTLDLHSDRSINLLLDRMDNLDPNLLRGSVEVHPSGLHVLIQPYDLTDLHQITADETTKLLAFLREHYDLVVVDVGSRMDVVSMSAALTADEVLLVSTTDVPSLRDAQRVLGLLRHLDVRPSNVRLVLNKVEDGVGVAPADVSTQLHVPIAATLPADHDACARVDMRGHLLWELAPHARITRALQALWKTLRGEASHPSHHLSWPWSHKS